MAEENTKDKIKLEELKRVFEGECCALSYNDDEEWFDDEDEEFVFDPNGSNKWFEDAVEQGLKEQAEMRFIVPDTDDKKSKDDESKDDTIVINIIFK